MYPKEETRKSLGQSSHPLEADLRLLVGLPRGRGGALGLLEPLGGGAGALGGLLGVRLGRLGALLRVLHCALGPLQLAQRVAFVGPRGREAMARLAVALRARRRLAGRAAGGT